MIGKMHVNPVPVMSEVLILINSWKIIQFLGSLDLLIDIPQFKLETGLF